MKDNVIKMGIKRDLAERLNSLVAIDDFEEDVESFKKLGFDVDSCVFSKRTPIDNKHFAELSVYTGQTNAWIECEVIYPNNVIEDFAEPIFDNIEGQYSLVVNGDIEYTLDVYIED